MKPAPKEVELTRSDVVVVQPQTQQFNVLPYFGRRVRRIGEVNRLELGEVLAAMTECRNADLGRGITAAIRLWKEQTEWRQKFDAPKKAAAILGGSAIAIAAICLQSPLAEMCLPFAGVLAVLALLNVGWLFKHRVVVRLYQEEATQIRTAAKTTIATIAAHCRLPRRLYADDVKGLRALARGDEHFERIAKEIVDSVGY